MTASYALAPNANKPNFRATGCALRPLELPVQVWHALSNELDALNSSPGFALIDVNAKLLTASEAFYRAEAETNLFSIVDGRVRLANRTSANWASDLAAQSSSAKNSIVARGKNLPSVLIASPLRQKALPLAILLRIATTPRRLSLDHQLLAALFYLTPAESAIAEHIARGDTIVEAATRRVISTNTARTHLKRLFSKTGTRRQSDLLRVLLIASVAAR